MRCSQGNLAMYRKCCVFLMLMFVLLLAGGAYGVAPTYVAAGNVMQYTGAITVPWPTHQAGDVALLVVESANQTISLSTPAGFAEVTGSPQGTGTAGGTTATRLAVFWKRATSSAEAQPTVADSGDHQIARIFTFRGVIASGNPWDVTASNVASTASTAVSIPGATTTVPDTLVAVIVSNVTDTTTAQTTNVANANLTSLAMCKDNNTSQGNGGGFGIWSGVKATAGAYGTTTATLKTSSVQGRMSIALKPASSAPGVATNPSPASGATNVGITTDLSWTAGAGATSHNVYFGTTSPGTYIGNQTATTYDTGTMTNNRTYYWRIDEVNAYGTTTGTVWNFTTIVALPGAASAPSPANGATGVGITTDLSWTAGSGATSHNVYFGTTSPGTSRGNQTATTYDTGTMVNSTVYYWRIDEVNVAGTTTGTVWSFTTVAGSAPGAASAPSPANGATSVSVTADLSWTAGSGATSHNVYFGTASPGTSRGNQTATTYDTGTMPNNTVHYWRIDEVNAYGTTTGTVWSFTTAASVSLVISSVSPATYTVQYDSLATGQLVYIDRTYTFTSVPSSLVGSTYIKTANADKSTTTVPWLTFSINQDCTVYCAHDDVITTKPSWMSTWSDTGNNLVTGSGSILSLYSKVFTAGTVSIGGNAGGVSSSMYSVVVVPLTVTPTGRQTLTESTTGRRYILYVPTDYDENYMYPLIVSSHGTAQNGDTEMDSTGPNNGFDRGTPTWPTLAEENDVIVACPDMTGAYGYPDWTSGQLTQLASDDTAIMAIITEIEGNYNINPNDILLTGFSGGGHVVHYVGLRHPDVFKATCARHGNFNTAEVPSPLPSGVTNMPVYIFTGSNDTTGGPPESIAWYTAQGFNNLDTDTFTTYPSSEHTTDRHHAMDWFMDLARIETSPSGHYVTYGGQTLMLVGDSGTQCAAQNSNLDHREWIDDCYDRGIRVIHVWTFIPVRQKQDGTVKEDRWGYVVPDVMPWARNTSGSLALDQKYDWNLQAFDEGSEGDFTHYWPRMRDLCSYARDRNMMVGITMFTGWAKPDQDPWDYHPLNATNGGHLTSAGDAVTIASPGTEVWQETYSGTWSNAKKTQWVWEKLSIKIINDLGSMGNVFFVFFDEHSYDDGNMETHFRDVFRSRGMVWVDEEDVRSTIDWVMSPTLSNYTDKNSHATTGFMTTPVRPYFNLEGAPYMGDTVRTGIWTFSIGGAHYIFHADCEQETARTGIMGYDPYVPSGDKGMYKRDWVGYASRFFNEYLTLDLDEFSPWNSLVGSGAYCLAEPGIEYAVYSKIGYSSITVNLSAASGKTMNCRFYDPRDGLFNSTFQRAGGSSSESFTKPSSDDWILHIVEQ